MGAETQKRSSLAGMTATTARMDGVVGGVGGRQEESQVSDRGGGYQDICTLYGSPLGPPGDPAAAIAELRQMGLAPVWIRLAEAIGFEKFLITWQTLDAANLSRPPADQSNVRVLVPMFSTYLRFRRNQFIRLLDSQGHDPKAIRTAVKTRLGETISLRHIKRLLVQANNKKT